MIFRGSQNLNAMYYITWVSIANERITSVSPSIFDWIKRINQHVRRITFGIFLCGILWWLHSSNKSTSTHRFNAFYCTKDEETDEKDEKGASGGGWNDLCPYTCTQFRKYILYNIMVWRKKKQQKNQKRPVEKIDRHDLWTAENGKTTKKDLPKT